MQNSLKKVALSSLLMAACTSSVQADWTEKMSILGYGNVDAGLASGVEGVGNEFNNFSMADTDLVFTFRPNSKLTVKMDIGFEDGLESETDKGGINQEYFFFDYKISDALKLRLGKQFTNFGIYNEIKAAKVSFMTIDRPVLLNDTGNTIGGEAFFPTAIVGLTTLGDVDVLEGLFYSLTISNGSNPEGEGDDLNQYNKDVDNNKAITAKIKLSLTDEWTVGMSLHTETFDNFEEKNTTSLGTTNLFSYGASLVGEITDDLALEIEYFGGTYQETPTSGVADDVVSRYAFSVMPSYALGDFTLYARYTAADADTNDNATYKGTASDSDVGFNYEFFAEGTSRMVFKMEYGIVNASSNTRFAELAGDITTGVSFSEINAQIAVSF